MDEHAFRKMLEGGGGAGGRAVRAALWLPGVGYGWLMQARRALYHAGVFHSTKAPVPVISVGNITAGGSGKTPFVIFLARELVSLGYKPGILLRGYRQSADGISDEAVLYRRACPDASVHIGPNRGISAANAQAQGATVLLMDDGFQHLSLQRDINIVLVDATSPWGGGNTIPGGLLREPLSALGSADICIITRSDQAPAAVPGIRRTLCRRAPDAPVFTARHAPVQLVDLSGKTLPLSRLAGMPVVALSGIARPEAFKATLEQLGANVAASLAGRDHADFDRETMNQAFDLAKNNGAVVVTTEKDRAKKYLCGLADNNADKYDIWTVGIRQEVENEKKLLQLIAQRLASASDKG